MVSDRRYCLRVAGRTALHRSTFADQPTVTWKRRPTPAVTPMAIEPHKTTRMTPGKIGAPPARAPTRPAHTKRRHGNNADRPIDAGDGTSSAVTRRRQAAGKKAGRGGDRSLQRIGSGSVGTPSPSRICAASGSCFGQRPPLRSRAALGRPRFT